ncbi:MAG: L,D-transpeptidase family protein [Pseudomonadota bacterium]|uniref:L,D-transpeptidase family protein n=1 Tax=Sphingobium naphthae TaxID=1886786 RepID=UPI002B09C103|nr:L,D-transpeptidase family protein [Pseudomonadota bacterium]
MHRHRLFLLLPLLLATAPAAAQNTQDIPLAPGDYRWMDEGGAGGPLYMVISIEKQRVHVYRGDRLIGVASVSTGMKGHRTPTGEYPILQKRQWHRSNLYSNAPMPFMQRLTWDGIALHAGHDPGYPASHGCIRMPYAFARQLFALTRIGTLVEVTQARLSAALQLDPLVVADPGSTVVSFESSLLPRPEASAPVPEAVPLLAIDPAIFWPRLRR